MVAMNTKLESSAEFLAGKASAIHRLARNVACDIVEIGGHLTEAKERCPHGEWLPWLKQEFAWSDDTALRLMRVYALVKSRKLRNLERLGPSVLYLLSAPSTSTAAREEIIARVHAGEAPSVGEAQNIIRQIRLVSVSTESQPMKLRIPRFEQAPAEAITRVDLAGVAKRTAAAAAVDTLLRFGQYAKILDVASLRSHLEKTGRARELFEAVSAAVSLCSALKTRCGVPDYLKPVEDEMQ
jgi:hypothetical protein